MDFSQWIPSLTGNIKQFIPNGPYRLFGTYLASGSDSTAGDKPPRLFRFNPSLAFPVGMAST
jgi:hypothetical protein